MTPKEEAAYVQGHQAMARRLMMECARELGVKDPLRAGAVAIAERAETVAALRVLCAAHGDNDWPDNMHLPDVIEKHLGRHLGDGKKGRARREG